MQRDAIAFANATLDQSTGEAFDFIDQPLVRPDIFADTEGHALGARFRVMVQKRL